MHNWHKKSVLHVPLLLFLQHFVRVLPQNSFKSVGNNCLFCYICAKGSPVGNFYNELLCRHLFHRRHKNFAFNL